MTARAFPARAFPAAAAAAASAATSTRNRWRMTVEARALVMLTATLTPLADAAVVLRHGGSRAVALGIHGATAVVMVLDAALLLLA